MYAVAQARSPFRGRVMAELLYCVLCVPLALLGFCYVLVTAAVGAALAVTMFGVPLLAAMVRGSAALGGVDRALARRLLRLDVADPTRPTTRGIVDWTRAALRDPAGWRAVAYRLVKFPLAVVTFGLTGLLWWYAFVLATFPLWTWSVSPRPGEPTLPLFGLPAQFTGEWDQVARWVIGVVLLLLAPWVTRLALIPNRWLVTGLLGPSTQASRLRELETSRAAVVDDAAARLRRIERDLHDGTQAHLVALAMKLGLAKDLLADDNADVAHARALVTTAHSGAKDVLTELRDLVRGIHPSVLDAGLEAALTTLAARSGLAVRLRVDLAARPSPAIETIAYFCVAELVTNVAKHSGTRAATAEVTGDAGLLRLRVGDAGRGGARIGVGSGLAGLLDRIRAVDGRLEISSPDGGPTAVTVTLPPHS